jgi:hypothetical protein
MYVLDDSFLTVAAYIDGCDAATGGTLLSGFDNWLFTTRVRPDRTSLAWPAVLLVARGLYNDRGPKLELTKEQNEQLVQDMFAALDEFLSSRDNASPPVHGPDPEA